MEYKKIYESSFSDRGYNVHDDSELRFQYVLNFLKDKNFNNVIDIGSGRGNLIKVLKQHNNNINIVSTDLKKFHDFDIPFYEINLCDRDNFKMFKEKQFELLTCLDVLEHIEKKCVDYVLYKFSLISEYSVLTIANHSDVLNGVELHVIQENMTFWLPYLNKYFEVVDQREHYNGRLYLLILKSINYE
jgi:hypothetical protein